MKKEKFEGLNKIFEEAEREKERMKKREFEEAEREKDRMKKRDPARLYPKYENITIENFLLENKQLVILIIIIVLFSLFIILCLLCIPYFQSPYTLLNGGV